jgi:hypothetical protein
MSFPGDEGGFRCSVLMLCQRLKHVNIRFFHGIIFSTGPVRYMKGSRKRPFFNADGGEFPDRGLTKQRSSSILIFVLSCRKFVATGCAVWFMKQTGCAEAWKFPADRRWQACGAFDFGAVLLHSVLYCTRLL